MLRLLIAGFVTAASLCAAEVHTLTMRQAIELALKQSPEVVLARLDEQRARQQVRIAKDPFTPKVYGGSGLAYTNGYPTSIEGSAPSIFEARTSMSLFNRQQSYQLASTRESLRGASLDAQAKSDDVAYKTATLFLDAKQATRTRGSVEREIASLERVSEAIRTRVSEGREIPLEAKRADFNLASARQRALVAAANQEYAEGSLALVLGYPVGDRVRAADDDSGQLTIPESEQATVQQALQNSREIKRLQAQLQSRMLDVRGYKSARLPVVDLVAQYSLLAKHNYVQFFNKFQRNNTELGVSVTLPLLVGSAAGGYLSQAEIDISKMRAQVAEAEKRISVDAAKGYQDVKLAESGRDVAKMDLDLTRDNVTVLLAQQDEGRVSQAQVDQARMVEQEKWIAYYDAVNTIEKAKLSLLRETGSILAALR
ncbi:MAG TPA: TolC family protein [Bryobacteraceae bacterium]|nr:TolC family protein [Bryobacteraceae bacterium]